MTTIAIRGDEMAADTQVSDEYSGLKMACTTKIERIETDAGDAILGMTGSVYGGLLFEKWFTYDDEEWRDEFGECHLADIVWPEDDFYAVLLSPEGLVVYNLYGVADTPPKNDFYAFGSGSKCALGALEMGATPREAVKAAAKHDLYTGGRVVTLKL